MTDFATRARSHLVALYGEQVGEAVLERLLRLVEGRRQGLPTPATSGLSQRDAILITYGDQVTAAGEHPLATLSAFCGRHLAGALSAVHILPFYPSSSDDGFAVIDYDAVDPALGDWDDVARLGRQFRLMFDAVVNHVSASSAWFRGFLAGDPRYEHFFHVIPPGTDLSRVVRPRALPLLTSFDTPAGRRAVWTTFSADQIDLNYGDPVVLLAVIEVLLRYVSHGAQLIRLDAIAYLWKEPGTACIHLPQVHEVIRLWRTVLDEVAPHVMLITETNVPHADNITYFGNGHDEAQLVYNFALPPLVLHTLQTGDATALTGWAADLSLPSAEVTFFNFLASHDGIGLNPVRGILRDEEITALADRAVRRGGLVSYKHNADGSQSPYELNINYFDALSDPAGGEPLATQVERFLAGQAIMLALVGVPGIYFHSLFGSRGWPEGVKETGRNRTINRQKYRLDDLDRELAEPGARRSVVLGRYLALLRARAGSPAFDPHGTMQVMEPAAPGIFALLRRAPDGSETVLCLQNVTDRPQAVAFDPTGLLGSASAALRDLVTGKSIEGAAGDLAAYQTCWLARADKRP
ncbi:MAG TPA: sugar phosphorylase [Anaerolineae bacterium]